MARNETDGAARRRATWPPAPTTPAAAGASARPRGRRLALVLAAAAPGALLLWLLLPRGGGRGAPEAPAARLPARPAPAAARASRPSPAAADAPRRAAKPAPEAPAPAPLPTYRDARGVLRYEGGARVPGQRPLAKPLVLDAHRPKVFRHAAEEHISWLLDMKVGEPVVGDYAYGDAFRRSLRASLDEPVEILETDDARTRELKAAVQETKEELRRRMAAGEDAAKIMNDTMDEFRRLARYRQDLQAQLREIRADEGRYSDRDVEDFTKAANEMLRREGMPPLAMPRALMRGLRRR